MAISSFRRSSGSCRRVLLIEDNPDGRESLRMLLSFLGHQVEVAADGVEGVRKALTVLPDVALVDIGLPGMNGYEVARRIRAALGRSVVLIAYTAYDSDETEQRVADAGFDAHLIKPIELKDLSPWLGEMRSVCGCASSLPRSSRTRANQIVE